MQVSDSSKIQILPNGLPRFDFVKSRNDGQKHPISSLRGSLSDSENNEAIQTKLSY
ncbi:hypothetical protein ACWIUD_11570 [Helicobacter sp. 23-1044]